MLLFIIGCYLLLRGPYGLVQLTWVGSLPAAAIRKARMIRFTPLVLRNGAAPTGRPVQLGFGPLLSGCLVDESNSTVSRTSLDSTVTFATTIDFDGWYFATGRDDAQFDPVGYSVHTSVGGDVWEPLLDSSVSPYCPSYVRNDDEKQRLEQAVAQAFPASRGVAVLRSFNDFHCLWPYYVIIIGLGVYSFSILIAPLLVLLAEEAPTQVLAWGGMVGALFKGVGVIVVRRWDMPLPFGPINYCGMSLALECLLEFFVFPGPLAYAQAYAIERAFIFGLLHTSVLYALGRRSVFGPFFLVVSGGMLMFREWYRRKSLRAVQPDRRLFDVAWDRLRVEEPLAEEHLARLRDFGQEYRLGLGAGKPLSKQRLRNGSQAASSPLMRMWQGVVGGGNAALAANEADGNGVDGRHKLMIEERSPTLSNSIRKVIAASSSGLSLDQLYGQATIMDPIFRVRVELLATLCRGHVSVVPESPGSMDDIKLLSELQADAAAYARVPWAEIKHVDQALRKSILNHGNISRLHDIVRQRIIFESLGDICKCLDLIAANPDLRIVSIKNGFDSSSDARRSAGYRQVVVLLQVVTEQTKIMGVSNFVCELLLAHRDMVVLLNPAQHDRYLEYRNVMGFISLGWWGTAGAGSFWIGANRASPSLARSRVFSPQQPSGQRADAISPRAASQRQHLEGGEWGASCAPVPSSECLRLEHVDASISELEPTGAEMQGILTERVYEVMRMRCHLPGNLLQSILNELGAGMRKVETSMLFFVRPLSLLLSPLGQLLLLVAGVYFIWLCLSSNLFIHHFNARHLRFRVLETRGALGASPDDLAKVPSGVGISELTLLRRQCEISSHRVSSHHVSSFNRSAHFTSAGLQAEVQGSTMFITLPQFVDLDGWAMSSSVEPGSADTDPVRFDIAYARLDASKYKFSDCLLGNEWAQQHEVGGMSEAEQRAAVVSKLTHMQGRWCSASDTRLCDDLDKAALLRTCLPASRVDEADWQIVSASSCRWGVYDVLCLPHSDEVFEYVNLDRGFRHEFHLWPPWYIVFGVLVAYFPIFGFLILSAVFGFLGAHSPHVGGFLQASRYALSLSFIVPGIMEVITAFALATTRRTPADHVNGWDSFYWWPLGIMSLLFGLVIMLSEKRIIAFLPLPFLVYVPALFIYNWFIIKNYRLPVPYSSVYVLSIWLVLQIGRQYTIRKSRQAIWPDAEAYESQWRVTTTSLEDRACIRDLYEVTERISGVTKGRPLQRMRDPNMHTRPEETPTGPRRRSSRSQQAVCHKSPMRLPRHVIVALTLAPATGIHACPAVCSFSRRLICVRRRTHIHGY